MSRLTKFVTPVGMCMTNLNSMKHYRPCVPCRDKAGIKTDGNGKQYTEKFSFCNTCEVKMLFNKLKHYEDLEEQGRLIITKYAKGQTVYEVDDETDEIHDYKIAGNEVWYDVESDSRDIWNRLDSFREDSPVVFVTKEEAEAKLKELKGE